MNVKKLLKRGVSLVLAAAMTCSTVVSFADSGTNAPRGNKNYLSNQGELIDTPFVQLPAGQVKPTGWLENQLLLQKDGITGNMEEFFPDYGENSGWLGGTGESWERGPYYLRGLVSLAYVLDDAELIEKAQNWIDWSIESQRADGFFGPTSNTDWWPRMPVLMAIREYYEATEARGQVDERVLPFMEKYFRYELQHVNLTSWAAARGGDNIESVYWLYNRLYDEKNPQDTAWLLELGTKLKNQTTNWTNVYNDTTVREHVVNTSQGMKTPPVYYQYSKSEADRVALRNGLFNMSIDHGRIDELPNSDEAARENRSTRGSETCGIVEGMLSTEIAAKILGEAWLGDRLEKMAYNSLPAAYTPDYSGHTYYILQNQVMATLGNHEFGNDHGDSSAFGAPNGFDCCFSNCHMGWSYFVQNMWMATANNGLAIVAYGPNKVTAKVADGKTAVFTQETNYPFETDNVALTYSGENDVAFELKLRIPQWCAQPTVLVNGEEQSGIVSGEYYTIDRTWNEGDKVDVSFPSELSTSTWYNDSIAVEKGPLIFSLKIDEDWRVYESNDARELKVPHTEASPLREVYPASNWNYGLIVDEENPASSFEVVVADEIPMQPFSSDTAPVTLKAKGQLLPGWVLDGNLAGPQPFGPTPYDENMVEDIELIPYGSARLKITHFPKIGDPTDSIVRTTSAHGKNIRIDGVDMLEFDNIVMPKASNYTLHINYTGTGSGTVILNGKYKQDVTFDESGKLTITELKNKLSGGFSFDAGHYNNVRIIGDVQVTDIEVLPVSRAIETVKVITSSISKESFKLITNLDAQETPYKVVYGTESGVYTNSAVGFESGTALITGIQKNTTYYAKVIASVKGQMMESPEIVLTPAGSGSGGLQPDPNVPYVDFKDNFDSPNYSEGYWKEYDPENKIQFNANKYEFGKGPKVKSVVNVEGAYDWVDYVAQADIAVTNVNNNNCGLMIRTTNVGDDSDAYNGYFVGIGFLGLSDGYRGPGLMIGYADGQWHDLKPIKNVPVKAGQNYTVKVVAYKNMFAVYVDDKLITTFEDDKFIKGTVGLRSYNEAFVADNVVVRSVTEEDLKVFMKDEPDPEPDPDPEFPPYVEANFADDFEDAAVSNAKWTKYGETSKINVQNGKIDFQKSSDVKAVAGDNTWSDYAVQADIVVKDGTTNNAGLMFRTKNEKGGPDSYQGYYFGVGKGGATVGVANNNWKTIEAVDMPVVAGQTYTLKVLAYQDKFAFYVDDKLVYRLTDKTYNTGKIGFRTYNEPFTADNVSVRPLSEEEIEMLKKQPEMIIPISAVTANETIQLHYPRIGNASRYRIEYGTQSGVYTDTFADFWCNTYATGAIRHDKVAFSGLQNNTEYFLRLVPMNGDTVLGYSEEISVTTGYEEDTAEDLTRLSDSFTKAQAASTEGMTEDSTARLDGAIAFAEDVLTRSSNSQMTLSLAAALLETSVKNLEKDVPSADLETKSASFDLLAPADISVSMILNGHTLTSITNNGVALVENQDYAVTENVVTLRQSYFAALAENTVVPLAFNFSGGKSQIFTVSVVKALPEAFEASMDNATDISGKVGTTFNVPVKLTAFPTDGDYKAMEGIIQLPTDLTLTDVVPSAHIASGNFEWNVDENGVLRFAFIDVKGGKLSFTPVSSATELLTLSFEVKNEKQPADTLEIAFKGMNAKTSDADVFTVFDTTAAKSTVSFKAADEMTASARLMYAGDGVDVIPAGMKAVAVEFANMDGIKSVSFAQNALFYSSEKTLETGKTTYVALLPEAVSIADMNNVANYTFADTAAEEILFGNVAGDTAINAEDALKIVSYWLRKSEPTEKEMLAANVNADGRIDTADSIAIIDFFLSGAKFAVITK